MNESIGKPPIAKKKLAPTSQLSGEEKPQEKPAKAGSILKSD